MFKPLSLKVANNHYSLNLESGDLGFEMQLAH